MWQKHLRDYAVIKAAARHEIFEFPGPRSNKIATGDLKNPSPWYHQNTKGVNIPIGMHKTGRSSGKTLPLPELLVFSGP